MIHSLMEEIIDKHLIGIRSIKKRKDIKNNLIYVIEGLRISYLFDVKFDNIFRLIDELNVRILLFIFHMDNHLLC